MTNRYAEKTQYFAEFVTLVRDMREAQARYFKTRNRADLIDSKQLEARVDKGLRYFLSDDE